MGSRDSNGLELVTLCLLVKDGKVLLGRKKKRIGAGMFNGFGGHIEEGESIIQAAIRELREETGIVISPSQLEKIGEVIFYENDTPICLGHIFLVGDWQGEPVESDEMGEFRWFDKDGLPYDEMLTGDREWFPIVLAGNRIKASIYYDENFNLLDFRWEGAMF